MRYIIALLLPLLLFSGCTRSVKKTQETNGLTPEELAKQELFDPELLTDTFIIPPPSFTTYEKVQAGKINLNLPQQDAGITAIDSAMSIPGYRIQIFSTTDRREAEETELNAIAVLIDENEQVYRLFDSPFHKIRVGDFIKREDAESFMKQKLIRLFPSSFIVPTKILPFQLAPRVFHRW